MLRSCLSVDTGVVALPFDMVQGHCTFLDRMHTWCYDLVIVRFCYRSFISFLFSLVNYAKRFFFLQIGLFCWMPVKSVSHSLALAQNILRNNGRKLVSIWSSFYWLHVSFLSFIGYFLSCEERKKPAKKLNASNLLPIFVINFVILFSDMNVCLSVCINAHFFLEPTKIPNNNNHHNKTIGFFGQLYVFHMCFEWSRFPLL